MRNPRIQSFLNWSVGVGSLFGVPIHLHISIVFFLIGALSGSPLRFWLNVEFAAAIVFCILLHELGHALTAKRYGLSGLSIMLHGFGGFAVSQGFRTWLQQLVISLAGPAVTIAIAGICLASSALGMGAAPIGSTAHDQFYLLHGLGILNLVMGCLNMIPSLPFDGGQAVAAMLTRRMPDQKARRAVSHLGLILGPILIVLGFAIGEGLFAMFGFMGAFTSAAYLMGTGGVRFGEAARDRKAAKEDEAFKKRQQARNEEFLSDVASRAREREEQERLRKLLE